MSLRQVLTIYNAERQLTDDETALLNTLRRMNDNERQMFVEGLSGKVGAGKKGSKKVAGKAASSSKSPRASSLGRQLQAAANTSRERCDHVMQRGANTGDRCNALEINPIHDETAGYAGYHPFVSSSPARNAGGRSSSKNGSPDESRVNSEVETESASSATGD